MSDSAEGNVPKAAPQAASTEPQPMTLAPEEAEKFASAFVPSWQFDDAPFSAGTMGQAELEQLGGLERRQLGPDDRGRRGCRPQRGRWRQIGPGRGLRAEHEAPSGTLVMAPVMTPGLLPGGAAPSAL